jgi:Xaa-Pro aminopeptidase
MIKNRLKRIKEKIRDNNIEGLMVTNEINRTYLSGFNGSSGLLIITQDSNYLITDFRYFEQAIDQSPDCIVIKQKEGIYDAVKELVEDKGIKSLSFESTNISYDIFLEISDKLKNITLLPTKGLVEDLRSIKDPEEIEIIQKAVDIADNAFSHILNCIRVGVTEWEIATELEYYMKKQGAVKVGFDIIVASGARASLPHGRATSKVIQHGDFVKMDFGAVYNGYCSDITRTVVVGECSNKQKEIYNKVLEAQVKAIEGLKPGISGIEGDLIARNVITEGGYGERFGHGLGHGIGMEVHEKPRLAPKFENILVPGNVVTVEPGIYIPSFGGVRIEDIVVIEPTGCKVLTKSTKELIIL